MRTLSYHLQCTRYSADICSALYSGLGNARTFVIERAFMKHTFQLSFVSHMGVKRKYCFSVPDAGTRSRWAQALHRQINQTRTLRSKQDTNELRKVAQLVSLQVLKDALLPHRPSGHTGQDVAHKSSANGDGNGNVNGNGSANGSVRMRQGSVSTTYRHLVSIEESELGPLQPPSSALSPDGPQSGLVDVQTGKELVLLCRQNSLLPGLLELLTVGREDTSSTSPGITSTMKTTGSRDIGNGSGNASGNGNTFGSRAEGRKGAMTMAGRF